VGVSNYDVAQFEGLAPAAPVLGVHLHLSLLHRHRAANVVPWCQGRNVPVFTFGVLHYGLAYSRRHERRALGRPSARRLRSSSLTSSAVSG
jgi:aryl-alcohol dehydrogenase-like predicted oxidoreductase